MIKINRTSRLIFTFLALVLTSVLLPAQANGQSKVEAYLRNADLDSDGKIEPHEMNGTIRRYLLSKGYDVDKRHKIQDVVKASEKKTSAAPAPASKLKVPKFGVEATAGAGVGSFATAAEKIQYSESVTKKTRELLEKYDQNGNGLLDEREIAEMPWGSPRPSVNDTNGDGRLTFVEIQGRYHDRESKQELMKSQWDNADEQGSGRASGDERRGRGRGRYGRGEGSSQETSSSSDSSSGRGATSSSPSDPEKGVLDRARDYVEKFFVEHDKDKNGILEGDELSKVRSIARYDTNRDNKIEQDEMLAVVSPESSRKTSARSSSGSRRTSINNSRSRSKTSGGFKKVDANGDDLVQMHEFSKKWTQKQFDEFLAKDKNGDGVIAPDEW